jgi:hypothetical protein
MSCLVVTLLLLAVPGGGDVPRTQPGGDPHAPRGYGSFGKGLANVGDLDGDGQDEFTVSDPEGSDPATVWILSGTDAHVVDRLGSPVCSREFGREVVRVPDVDGDRVDEIAVSEPPGWESCSPGLVRLYSGHTRTLLRTIVAPRGVERFGFDIAGLADVDGDRSGDLLAMSADSNSERCGFVFSGATAGLLFEIWRPDWLSLPRVAPTADVDGDGCLDLALTGTDCVARQPVALLHSGRDGRMLEEVRGSSKQLVLGLRAADVEARSVEGPQLQLSIRIQRVLYERAQAAIGVIGDVDGDGESDCVLTDPDDGCFFYGSVTCRSGRSGRVIWEEPPWPTWRNVELLHMGRQLAVIGDLDQDGVRDFIWATENACTGNPGLAFISSGKTGRALKVLARGPNLEILRLGPKE